MKLLLDLEKRNSSQSVLVDIPEIDKCELEPTMIVSFCLN